MNNVSLSRRHKREHSLIVAVPGKILTKNPILKKQIEKQRPDNMYLTSDERVIERAKTSYDNLLNGISLMSQYLIKTAIKTAITDQKKMLKKIRSVGEHGIFITLNRPGWTIPADSSSEYIIEKASDIDRELNSRLSAFFGKKYALKVECHKKDDGIVIHGHAFVDQRAYKNIRDKTYGLNYFNTVVKCTTSDKNSVHKDGNILKDSELSYTTLSCYMSKPLMTIGNSAKNKQTTICPLFNARVKQIHAQKAYLSFSQFATLCKVGSVHEQSVKILKNRKILNSKPIRSGIFSLDLSFGEYMTDYKDIDLFKGYTPKSQKVE